MLSYQRLVFQVIIFDVFRIEWFADWYWSSRFDQRVCPSKVGIMANFLAHARLLCVNVSRSEIWLMRRISASFKETSLTWLSMHVDISMVEIP